MARRDAPGPRGPGPPLVLRGRLRRRRDRHLRLDLGRAGRVRPGRPGARAHAEGGRARVRRPRRVLHARAAPLGRGLHGAGHEVPHPRAHHVRRVPGRLRGAGARAPGGGRRPPADRDAVRPALHQGCGERRPARHGVLEPVRPAAGPGHDRAHRPHAAGHRDRRRPHRPRRHAGRRRRPQLRDRPGRDERGPAPSLVGQPRPDRLRPQRGPAIGGRRPDALRPHPRGPGRAPAPFRHRVRRLRDRRLLRDHAGPPGGGGGALRRRHSRRADPGARTGRSLHLHLGPLHPGHLVPRGGRAHQRQWFQGLPRGDAGGATGTPVSPWRATRSRRVRT